MEADAVEEEEPAPEPESEEMKQLRDLIQVAMGAELKQVGIQSLVSPSQIFFIVPVIRDSNFVYKTRNAHSVLLICWPRAHAALIIEYNDGCGNHGSGHQITDFETPDHRSIKTRTSKISE